MVQKLCPTVILMSNPNANPNPTLTLIMRLTLKVNIVSNNASGRDPMPGSALETAARIRSTHAYEAVHPRTQAPLHHTVSREGQETRRW